MVPRILIEEQSSTLKVLLIKNRPYLFFLPNNFLFIFLMKISLIILKIPEKSRFFHGDLTGVIKGVVK